MYLLFGVFYCDLLIWCPFRSVSVIYLSQHFVIGVNHTTPYHCRSLYYSGSWRVPNNLYTCKSRLVLLQAVLINQHLFCAHCGMPLLWMTTIHLGTSLVRKVTLLNVLRLSPKHNSIYGSFSNWRCVVFFDLKKLVIIWCAFIRKLLWPNHCCSSHHQVLTPQKVHILHHLQQMQDFCNSK